MNLGLKDKVVLITGASSGNGAAAAKCFSEEGAKVAVHYRSERAAAEETQSQMKTESFLVAGDVSSEKDVERIFKETIEHFGKIDIVVANAGIFPQEDMPIDQVEAGRFKKVMEVNQFGAWLTCRAYFRHLREKKSNYASLVITASTSGIFGEEGWSDYSMSKASLHGLVLTLKNEIVRIVPNGRVNAVAPGWILTPMSEKFANDKKSVVSALQTQALRRLGRPEEVARQIVWLASDEASGHVTGQILRVDGGMEGRKIWEPEDIDPAQA